MKLYRAGGPAVEFRVVCLQESPTAKESGDTPEKVVEYLRKNLHTATHYNPDVESMVAVMLNARRRIIGHSIIATGLVDTVLCHAREVFRSAIVANACAVVLAHNHPSGDPSPSEADIKVTRDMIRAGQLLKIELLDHVILGDPANGRGYASLRELGYFYT